MRTRAETRHADWNHAIRKYKIAKICDVVTDTTPVHWYSKGKVHCSCPMCRYGGIYWKSNSLCRFSPHEAERIRLMRRDMEEEDDD